MAGSQVLLNLLRDEEALYRELCRLGEEKGSWILSHQGDALERGLKRELEILGRLRGLEERRREVTARLGLELGLGGEPSLRDLIPHLPAEDGQALWEARGSLLRSMDRAQRLNRAHRDLLEEVQAMARFTWELWKRGVRDTSFYDAEGRRAGGSA
ncbi:MAG: flagellar export chaperone FlgN [Bacillota bacterium]|nr:flagellar export chaperone FlgN [Bacillota bacterium]